MLKYLLPISIVYIILAVIGVILIVKEAKKENNKDDMTLIIISFLVPLIGLIIYAVNVGKDKHITECALNGLKMYLKFLLAHIILCLLIILILYLVYNARVNRTLQQIKENENKNVTETITPEPFNIYLMGAEKKENIFLSSDVNMVLSINPKTHNILITAIPRYYYLSLYGINSTDMQTKEMLAYASVYGDSKETISHLLNTQIDYSIPFDYSSIIKLVDTLESVDVYSKNDFVSSDESDYKYINGYNTLNKNNVLPFFRERKAFTLGDYTRLENQSNVIKAIIEKISNKNTNNSDILTIINDLIINDESVDNFSVIKHLLENKTSWKITTNILKGTDSYEYSYMLNKHGNNTKIYVVIPDDEIVKNARNKIKDTLNY